MTRVLKTAKTSLIIIKLFSLQNNKNVLPFGRTKKRGAVTNTAPPYYLRIKFSITKIKKANVNTNNDPPSNRGILLKEADSQFETAS